VTAKLSVVRGLRELHRKCLQRLWQIVARDELTCASHKHYHAFSEDLIGRSSACSII